MVSTFGWWGSVKSKNFVPVNVWKQLKRKWDDSRTSMPVRSLEGTPRMEGVKDFAMACTPWKVPARTSRSFTETLLRALLKSRL